MEPMRWLGTNQWPCFFRYYVKIPHQFLQLNALFMITFPRKIKRISLGERYRVRIIQDSLYFNRKMLCRNCVLQHYVSSSTYFYQQDSQRTWTEVWFSLSYLKVWKIYSVIALYDCSDKCNEKQMERCGRQRALISPLPQLPPLL